MLKKLSFRYILDIKTDIPMTNHSFTLRCIPESSEYQEIQDVSYDITPNDFLSEDRDQWGNRLIYGSCRNEHTVFSVCVTGTAVTGLSSFTDTSGTKDIVFSFPTELTKAGTGISAFTDSLGLKGMDPLYCASVITEAVHDRIIYAKGITNVRTSAEEAFLMSSGVCQDYSHIMIAALRHLSIPSRYVVGMVPGEGESHAWVEVLSGDKWYGFDPTFGTDSMDGHIKISHGRDYLDCIINRGIFRGNARQKTSVSVTVSEI